MADAERKGARTVEIHDAESGQTYSATIAQIRARGVKLDRGFGKQLCLPLEKWTIHKPGSRQMDFGGVS